jgi:hypothetical protein
VPAQDVFRLELPEIARRAEAKERMDAQALARRDEVPNGPQGVGDDEDPPRRLPESDLLPEAVPDDPHELASRGRSLEPHAQVGNAEPLRDSAAIALVTIEELDDGFGPPERAEPLVQPWHVERIEDEHRAIHLEGMRRPRKEARLGPAEAAVERVRELEAQPPRNVW